MFLLRSHTMQASALDQDAPEGVRRMVIRRDPVGGKPELVEMRWGLKPKETGGHAHRFIRSEEKSFPTHRCLIPASEFHIRRDKRSYRVRLDDGNFFYLAGIWRPASPFWPNACAVVTVDANADVSRYQDRQGAVIRRNRHLQWLDLTLPEAELLQPLPARSFVIEELTDTGEAQGLLAV
jgi:putative SOS response-associated peptidase YedK